MRLFIVLLIMSAIVGCNLSDERSEEKSKKISPSIENMLNGYINFVNEHDSTLLKQQIIRINFRLDGGDTLIGISTGRFLTTSLDSNYTWVFQFEYDQVMVFISDNRKNPIGDSIYYYSNALAKIEDENKYRTTRNYQEFTFDDDIWIFKVRNRKIELYKTLR